MSQFQYGTYKWGMAIDLDRCTGCQACVTACRIENNQPWVGEEEVAYGRSFQWIRVDRYWEGDYPNLKARYLPVLCQQCQNAPCEPVCPVYATYTDAEGISEQIYNRCVGTRFCGNNCPYSTRFFNWFDPKFPEEMTNYLNPLASVRTRGVMEKCNFCIHRIREQRHTAALAGRRLYDGEMTPACAQACPADVITFGDLNDTNSRVSQFFRDPRRYYLLEEIGTQPVVVYLKGYHREGGPGGGHAGVDPGPESLALGLDSSRQTREAEARDVVEVG